MVEIIKRGTKQIKICKQCGCKFSYEVEDIQRNNTDDYKALAFIEYVQCPQCKENVIIRQVK